jgi:hypothetical protein
VSSDPGDKALRRSVRERLADGRLFWPSGAATRDVDARERADRRGIGAA